MGLRKGQPPAKVHLCDCSEVAYKKDGSGWVCRGCAVAIPKIQKGLDEFIKRQRAWMVRERERERWEQRKDERNAQRRVQRRD